MERRSSPQTRRSAEGTRRSRSMMLNMLLSYLSIELEIVPYFRHRVAAKKEKADLENEVEDLEGSCFYKEVCIF